ncbi:MAG: DUF3108 domain-containing protein [Pseudomonadota bacterium]
MKELNTDLPKPPGWRLMAGLTLVVVFVHWLVLQAAPLHLSPQAAAEGSGQKSFVTRSITLPPAEPQPLAVSAPPPRPAPKPRPKKSAVQPEIESKQPVSPVPPASVAIDSVAESNTPGAPENVAETRAQALTSTVAAITATSAPPTAAVAASTPSTPAPAAPPAGPQATVVTAINLPSSAKLQYKATGEVKGLTYHANAELTWNNSGSQYEALLRVSAFLVGLRTMSSMGQVTANGLAPTRFSDKNKAERAAHFDADKGKITFSANTPDAPWLEGAQDRVSVFFQLGGILAARPGLVADGSSITIYTAGPSDADNWTFVLEAQEQLSLPAGDMATLKLTRKPRREYDIKVEIWYAPSLGYLPVRNRITQANGDFLDQELKSVVKP